MKTSEYALLEAALPGVEGCSWPLCWEYNNRLEFLGKKAGWVGSNNKKTDEKFQEFIKKYELMKTEARLLVN